MTEELKYKVGDKVLVEAEVIRADNSHGNPYQILFDDGRTFALNRGMLEDNAIQLPPKPKVPQAVMEYYKQNISADYDYDEWFERSVMPDEVASWLYYDAADDILMKRQYAIATLIIYGPEAVEVEKEKKYKVISQSTHQTLTKLVYKHIHFDTFKFKDEPEENIAFTKQELIEAGFGGVFDNEMFEVEEVVND